MEIRSFLFFALTKNFLRVQRPCNPADPSTLRTAVKETEVLENKIYVLGGYDDVEDTTTEDAECFDPSTSKWKRIAPMKVGRSGLSSCLLSGLKNVQEYILDSESRSVLNKYFSEDLTETIESLDINSSNDSQATYQIISF
ncbi:kelch-like protein 10 [Trichonephila inaurata madagascariensis]|uniref:Kelch-like protein 10 n=1 Tax=Trichonephila inaurata madagascariensis TaxID=2747483 RepID=A0A8X6YK02_9ARAC|nr:kelch-like protein 10 [Trichonephila inaurata madagascariensis]